MVFEIGTGVLFIFLPFIFFFLIIGVIIYLIAKKAKSVSVALENPEEVEKKVKESARKRASELGTPKVDILKENAFYIINTNNPLSTFKSRGFYKTDLFTEKNPDTPTIILDQLVTFSSFKNVLPQGLIILWSANTYVKMWIKEKKMFFHKNDEEVGMLDYETKKLFVKGEEVGHIEHIDYIVSSPLGAGTFQDLDVKVFFGGRLAARITLFPGRMQASRHPHSIGDKAIFAEIHDETYSAERRAIIIGLTGFVAWSNMVRSGNRRR